MLVRDGTQFSPAMRLNQALSGHVAFTHWLQISDAFTPPNYLRHRYTIWGTSSPGYQPNYAKINVSHLLKRRHKSCWLLRESAVLTKGRSPELAPGKGF
jgi:hypothetical protein